MVAGSMEVIDLSSDGEDIIDLSLESESDDSIDLLSDDSTDLWSDTEDELDSDSPSNHFHQNLIAQPASFFRPPENKPATKLSANSQVQSFSRPIPSKNSVIDVVEDERIENVGSTLFGCDERAVYEEALQHIGQEKREEDLPEGVLSVSLLKHQRIALAWMLSKENSTHCAGGILADDQTISTIALIQKERTQQSMFMNADSDLIDDDEAVISLDKMELNAYASRSRSAGSARMTKNIKSQSQPKKKTRNNSSASALLSTSRPAAGTLVVCPASVLKQWASELSSKVTQSAKLSVLVYHGGSRTRDPTELVAYDVVVTTYAIVAREVPKGNTVEEQESIERYGTYPAPPPNIMRGKAKKKTNNSNVGPLAMNPPSNAVVASCGHVFCKDCVQDILANSENVSSEENVSTSGDENVSTSDGETVLTSDDSVFMSDDENGDAENFVEKVRVIIMSLKAGNLGLNMVYACHVIMLDPWWNPSAEDQAVDRAHRIGQTRPVTVSRLTIKDTVEDRILSLQENKKTMIQSAFGEDESGGNSSTRFTAEDLRYLFKGAAQRCGPTRGAEEQQPVEIRTHDGCTGGAADERAAQQPGECCRDGVSSDAAHANTAGASAHARTAGAATTRGRTALHRGSRPGGCAGPGSTATHRRTVQRLGDAEAAALGRRGVARERPHGAVRGELGATAIT
ncbi:hypothetical protein PR202_ga18938 [Eleusine coracana subsp. coracana]|uniref:Helicase C-terminal domain-containing protein n=1 Tax=Eleusine coracana subsp. coracana TaxID=191504 RepID=A0AAV5CUN3_ELECO|nr:hypothetical protein PR202_ga18938 [Eleusine coracana subsp. coracana]